MYLEQVKELLHGSSWVCEMNLSIGVIHLLNFQFLLNNFLQINSDNIGEYKIIQEDKSNWITFHPFGSLDRLKIIEIEKDAMTLRKGNSIFLLRKIY